MCVTELFSSIPNGEDDTRNKYWIRLKSIKCALKIHWYLAQSARPPTLNCKWSYRLGLVANVLLPAVLFVLDPFHPCLGVSIVHMGQKLRQSPGNDPWTYNTRCARNHSIFISGVLPHIYVIRSALCGRLLITPLQSATWLIFIVINIHIYIYIIYKITHMCFICTTCTKNK